MASYYTLVAQEKPLRIATSAFAKGTTQLSSNDQCVADKSTLKRDTDSICSTGF